MSPQELQIVQHSLGVDKHGGGEMSRNHFCAGGRDEELCRGLVSLGLMRLWPHADPITGKVPGYPYFNCSVTDEGIAAMRAESPLPQKFTRGQARYREFLRSNTDMSFIEYLKARKIWLRENGGGK